MTGDGWLGEVVHRNLVASLPHMSGGQNPEEQARHGGGMKEVAVSKSLALVSYRQQF